MLCECGSILKFFPYHVRRVLNHATAFLLYALKRAHKFYRALGEVHSLGLCFHKGTKDKG